MALYVYVVGTKERHGPYPESKFRDILAYARISAQKGDHARDLVWDCGGKAQRIRRYNTKGQKVGPAPDIDKVRRCIRRASCPTKPKKAPKRSNFRVKNFVCPT